MSPPPSLSARAVAAAVAAALHLAVLAPGIGEPSSVLDRGFGPQGRALAAGADPYGPLEFEYPPLAAPVVAAPAELSSSQEGYREAFTTLMLIADLAIVLLLASFAGPGRRELTGALAVYTGGVAALTGFGPLPSSAIEEAPLALARFDLIPAALALAAVLAAARGRSALWGLLLATGAAIKAFPLALAPALVARGAEPRRIAVGAAAPIAVAAAIVVTGGGFGDAFAYHSDRDLHAEAVAATPLELAHLAGAELRVETGSGSYNLAGGAAGVARAISLVALVAGFAAVALSVLRRRPPIPVGATALLAVAVVAAPVLSPQFLLWLLPLSALALGASAANAALVGAAVLTQVMLSEYAGIVALDPGFVWTLAARNTLLVTFAVLAVFSLRDYPAGRWPARPSST